MSTNQIIEILKYAWPILLLQIGLQIYAIWDLSKQKSLKNLSKPIWVIIILLGEIVGPIAYLLFGKNENE